VIAARNEGLLSSWRDLRDEGQVGLGARKRWIAGGVNTCDFCVKMDGADVPLDQPFMGPYGPVMRPPIHPMCRCTLALVSV
jgi:hypothetical protein